MRSRLAAAVAVAVVSFTAPAARAGHTPLYPDNLRWKDLAGAYFSLEIAWTQGWLPVSRR